MLHTRREILKFGVVGTGLSIFPSGSLFGAKINSTVRGVKLGITSASLNPLPEVAGKDPLDVLIGECVQLGVANIELSSGYFGPSLVGSNTGQVPAKVTPEYQKSRDALREWRLSSESLDRFREVRKRFDEAGLNLFSISNTFADDVTEPEIDAMFREMEAMRLKLFQTNQTRVSMGPRLVPFAEKYHIRPSFHTHAMVNDPNEIASVESLDKVLNMSKDFMVCLDIGHFTAGNNDATAYLQEHHSRITHIHVKDRKRNNGPNVEWGTGDTPIKECMTLIRDKHYPIPCLMEREFKGTGTAMEETQKDLDYMKRILQT